jgi:hypothetical protein
MLYVSIEKNKEKTLSHIESFSFEHSMNPLV